MAELVASTYGNVLYDVAIELDQANQIFEQIKFIEDVFDKEKEFFNLFISPLISKEEKKEVIQNVFKEKISMELLNFLYVLIDKKRTVNFPEIVVEYGKLVYENQNMLQGTVYSAVKLTLEQVEALENKLSGITGKTIKLDETIIDDALIGGVKIKIEDRVIDFSVRNKIKEIKEEIDSILI